MLQKTYTVDFITDKKTKNVGQRNRYYVSNSHPAIVSAGVFDKVQEEISRRARLVCKEDGTVETKGRKYNGKYFLGNVLICGYCGASYRRRTERGKVVWRCGTRMEKGKENCADSPTLNEEWIKTVLRETVCENSSYDKEIVRNRVEKIIIFNKCLDICCKNGEEDYSYIIAKKRWFLGLFKCPYILTLIILNHIINIIKGG